MLPNIFGQDCLLQVPNDPLNTGLFQPWFVSTAPGSPLPCSQLIKTSAVFVEATILDIATGKLFVYNPLTVDVGAQPALPIVVATLPVKNVVIINIGANGNSVTLTASPLTSQYQPNSLVMGQCVNGFKESIFGQVAYCNGPQFFQQVNNLIATGLIVVPPLQNSLLGDICPTTRSFAVVDQDQSDNILTEYLITATNQVAQNTPANKLCVNWNAVANTDLVGNGSDNRLLDKFIAVAIGCAPFQAPDLANPTILKSSLALNEIQANLNDPNSPDTALVAINNPMVLVNGQPSIDKINAYRLGVNQPPLLINQFNVTQNTIAYCNSLARIAIPFYMLHINELTNFASPDATGNNLLNFLCNRFANSWVNLNCQMFTGVPSAITVTIVNNTAIANNLLTLPSITPVPTIPRTSTVPGVSTASTVPGASTASTVPGASTASRASTPSTTPRGSPESFCGYIYNNLTCSELCLTNLDCLNGKTCYIAGAGICDLNTNSTNTTNSTSTPTPFSIKTVPTNSGAEQTNINILLLISLFSIISLF